MGNAIEIKGLKKAFGGHEVITGLDLQVAQGENLVVLGKSGSGKSVIIKCLVNLIEPDDGELLVLGQDLGSLRGSALLEARKKIGFLFQSGALYDSMTVRQNLEFPLRTASKKLSREETDALVVETLKSVDLESSIDKMPSGLSGGMRKRLGLARTLIMKPEVMLYDEPTTGLDSITSKEISQLLLQIQAERKTSAVIITHDLECARLTGDRIAVLKDGKFVAEGSYDELRKSDDTFVRSFFGEETGESGERTWKKIPRSG